MVQAEGLEEVFECLYPGATAYSWALNGTFQSVFPLGVRIAIGASSTPASLTIPAIPEYNNTVIQCRAVIVVETSPVFVLSDNATLTVYGESVILLIHK